MIINWTRIKIYVCTASVERNKIFILHYVIRHNVKKAINGYWVINIFECPEYYLIHSAKGIFRKFPKIVILKNIFILPQISY